MGLLFQFLNLLRAEGPQKWVFDELANIAQMRFKFAEEEDACEYALRLAADAPYYAPEHLLNGHYLYDRWDPKLVSCIWNIPSDCAQLRTCSQTLPWVTFQPFYTSVMPLFTICALI